MKKRSLLDSIDVKKPCTQDWDLMYGNEQVRFCEHCVKDVHDLSAMTRKKAERLVTRSNGSICVRYVRRPDGKIQTIGDKLYQISGRASRLAAGVFGASLTLVSAAPSAYAQGDAISLSPAQETVARPDKPAKETPKEKTTGSVYGTITDVNGAVITGVKITLTDEKLGTQQTGSSNGEGYYIFSSLAEGKYKLHFESPGFSNYDIQDVTLKAQADAKYDVTLPVADVGAAVMVGDIAIAINYENQLVLAVHDNDIERVKQLIGQGANVNEKDNNEGLTALHLAVREGKTEIVELLLGAGAKVNLRDESRRTALMMIAYNYYSDNDTEEGKATPEEEIFKLLIGYGAKVNLRDSEGVTALMYAAQHGEPQILKLLLSHRANIDAQSKTGRTALMDAVEEGQIECVRALLEAGANVDLREQEGQNALSLCSDADIRQLLIAFGAREEEAPAEEEPGDN